MEIKKALGIICISVLCQSSYASDVIDENAATNNVPVTSLPVNTDSATTVAVAVTSLSNDANNVTTADAAIAASNNVTQPLPALQGSVDVEALKNCIASVNKVCNNFQTYEQRDACVTQELGAGPQHCAQAQAIYQKMGLLPDRIQAIGPLTVFTLYHIADGQETFYIIDSKGEIISLADDSDPAIAKNKEFIAIKKKNPDAGLMQLISGDVTQIPQVVMPQELANKKQNDVIQLIFPQLVKKTPCLSCEDLKIADISYRFTRNGEYLGPEWLKTEQLAAVITDKD